MIEKEVEFNGNEEVESKTIYNARRKIMDLSSLSLTNIVKKMRLARTDAQARYALIAIGIVSLAAAIFITMYFIFGIGKYKSVTHINVPLRPVATTTPRR